MRVGVIGLGYLGATHAVAMAKLGHEVVGFERSSDRLEALSAGKLPFFEPGLESALTEVIDSGSLSFAANPKEAELCELYFLCVGTPQADDTGKADTSFVFAAGLELAAVISPETVVAGKSTVPVGTARELQRQMSEASGFEVLLAWNPEFLREGTALEDSLQPDRIVVGSDNPSDKRANYAVLMCYESLIASGVPVIETDLETAELVKVAANAFLATKISFINGMAEVAEASGADAVMLAKAIGYDERIGNKFLRTGAGFGGGCLPKDIRGFAARAQELGVGEAVGFLNEVDQINKRRRQRVIDIAHEELGALSGKKVVVLGLAFKPDSDDMRDSPALDIALGLARAGAEVSVHDPVALDALGERHQELLRARSLDAAFADQELVVLATEWKQYKELDPGVVGKAVAVKTVIDARNVLDVESWQKAGWRLIALGRNVHKN